MDALTELTLPGFVDGHCHLDKTLLGTPWLPHRSENTVAGRIVAERAGRGTVAASVHQRARLLLAQMVAHGTTALRTHVDIDTSIGLSHLHAVLRVREETLADVDLQIVAFPQSGILRDAGVLDLMDAALSDGADLVGGLDPAAIDGDRVAHLDAVFGLAAKHGKGIDIHLHEGGETGLATIDDICRRVLAEGLQGKVVISHAFALGEAAAERIGPVADHLARAQVAILTSAPGQAAMPPIKQLRSAGVEAFAGSDNIRDLWSPFGNGDMLERAMLVAWRQNFRSDDDLELALAMITSASRRALGLPDDSTTVTLVAESRAHAVVSRPARRLVRRANRVLAEGGACRILPVDQAQS